jgi:hypothetical protein
MEWLHNAHPETRTAKCEATAVFPELGWRNESPKRHAIALADDLELHCMEKWEAWAAQRFQLKPNTAVHTSL